jgi:hypothetical protein
LGKVKSQLRFGLWPNSSTPANHPAERTSAARRLAVTGPLSAGRSVTVVMVLQSIGSPCAGPKFDGFMIETRVRNISPARVWICPLCRRDAYRIYPVGGAWICRRCADISMNADTGIELLSVAREHSGFVGAWDSNLACLRLLSIRASVKNESYRRHCHRGFTFHSSKFFTEWESKVCVRQKTGTNELQLRFYPLPLRARLEML